MSKKNIDKVLAARDREHAALATVKGPLRPLVVGPEIAKYAPPEIHDPGQGLCFCTRNQYRPVYSQGEDNMAYEEKLDYFQAKEIIAKLLSSINLDFECIQSLVASHGTIKHKAQDFRY